MRASDEWKVGPDPAAEIRETRARLCSTAAMLRDFYVAWAKPAWKAGENETEAASRVVNHLAKLEQDGIEEARLPDPDIEGDG